MAKNVRACGLFISHGGNVEKVLDGPKYFVLPIPIRGLKISTGADIKITLEVTIYLASLRKYREKLKCTKETLLQRIWT